MLALASDDGSLPYTLSIHLGQLSVFPKPTLPGLSPFKHRLLWADCTPVPNSPDALLLTWDACISYTDAATIRPEDLIPEVPHPPWTIDRSPGWFPRLAYANVYVEKRTAATGVRPSSQAIFLGTSGWGSGATTGVGSSCFLVQKSGIPEGVGGGGSVRFFVQGVLERGRVMSWDECVYVDFEL